MTGKDVNIYLEHILDNIRKIETFSKGISKEDLVRDELRQYALVRAIEIIGEAVKNLPGSVRDKYPNVPWKEIIGTRDLMIHRYFGVDLDVVWNIIKIDIPKFKRQVEVMKKKVA